jgi:hypothetical protein
MADYTNYAGRFGGLKVVHPEIGSEVEVRPGRLFAGERFKVLDVAGHLYSIGYRVYVDAPSDEPVWYWPWDLVIL